MHFDHGGTAQRQFAQLRHAPMAEQFTEASVEQIRLCEQQSAWLCGLLQQLQHGAPCVPLSDPPRIGAHHPLAAAPSVPDKELFHAQHA
jgi:hypothetical protein